MKHYSEADLLETYYTQPGDSMPVMMHLADCAECAARYERLERKIRGLGACEHDKPETFWARQRMLVMRKIDTRQSPRFSHLAAAAALVLVLGGVITWNEVDKSSSRQVVKTETTQTASAETVNTVSDDPWQSEELQDYQSMVAWESWVDSDTKNGESL